MKNTKRLKTFFLKQGWDFNKNKPTGTGIKWSDIGEELGISANAARCCHLRHRLDLTESKVRLKEKEDSFMGELDRVVVDLPKKPKILFWDLETSPLRSLVWSLWKQNINATNGQLLSEWFCLTWSAKWLDSSVIMSGKLTGKEVLAEDDSRLMKSLWELINDADIIVAHNAAKFDVKRMNTRFLKHGLQPPSSYEVIDTLVHARKRFSIPSNRLDYLGIFLGLGRKVDTGGFDLWAKCMQGDDEALEKIRGYCDGDIELLQKVYLELLPWIQPHPNLGLYVDSNVPVCPSCGSNSLEENGSYVTTMNTYQEYKCNHCGANSRSRKSNTTKETKGRLLSSLPK